MKIETLQNKIVKIENSQSTFVILKNEENIFRFDLLDKREFYIKNGIQAELKYFEDHPLLIDYSENSITVFINSKPEKADEFITEIEKAVNEITLGWRNWKNYMNDGAFFKYETFLKNIKDGNGKLIEAPFSIAQNVLKVCDKYKVSAKAINNQIHRKKYKLIMIDDNYIIAKDFIPHQ